MFGLQSLRKGLRAIHFTPVDILPHSLSLGPFADVHLKHIIVLASHFLPV